MADTMPSNSSEHLAELLISCTVSISIPDGSVGSGFFVAPSAILTCAHVVKNCVSADLKLCNKVRALTPLSIDRGSARTNSRASADLALIHVQELLPIIVWMDAELQIGDALFTYGYPPDHRQGESATAAYEGPVDEPPLLKLKSGQISVGMSGSPLLRVRTGATVGILSHTRGRYTDLGGLAISIATVLEAFPELVALQRDAFKSENQWITVRKSMGSASKNLLPHESSDHLKRLLTINSRRLEILEEQNSYAGRDAMPSKIMEAADLKQEIIDLQRQLLDRGS